MPFKNIEEPPEKRKSLALLDAVQAKSTKYNIAYFVFVYEGKRF